MSLIKVEYDFEQDSDPIELRPLLGLSVQALPNDISQCRHDKTVSIAAKFFRIEQDSLHNLAVIVHLLVLAVIKVEHLRVEQQLVHDDPKGKHILLLVVRYLFLSLMSEVIFVFCIDLRSNIGKSKTWTIV